ncbi:MAG: glycosyltransferase [Candidatus Adiutrix sp.]|jgi:glycosyltransferase involved in cell wall biosynthesis|nr:glycosyltransferase [Candidatus Adiutrix sp.]
MNDRPSDVITLMSYAPRFEDIFLWRALGAVNSGVYADIGASDPDSGSVSRLFHERGWRGLHAAADGLQAKKLREQLPGDMVVAVNLLSAEAPVLDDLLAKIGDGDLHWLRLDVGGRTAEILSNWSGIVRPWVVVVAGAQPAAVWEGRLAERGYRFAYADDLNRFYLQADHADLEEHFSYGLNPGDGFILSRTSPYCAWLERERAEAAAEAAEAALRLRKAAVDLEALSNEVARLSGALTRVCGSRGWRFLEALRAAPKAVLSLGRRDSWRGALSHIYSRDFLGGLADGLERNAPGLYRGLRNNTVLRGLYQGFKKRLPSALEASVDPADGHNGGMPTDIFAAAPVTRPLPPGRRTLFYYVDHTPTINANTGVQQVVRQLAKAWLDGRENLRFIKWSPDAGQLVYCNQGNLEALADWDGPPLDEKRRAFYRKVGDQAVKAEDVGPGDWLVSAEVPHLSGHHRLQTLELIYNARVLNLKTAFIFYDSTPLKRPELAATMASVHALYMQNLMLADLIVPGSQTSADDLRDYLEFHEAAAGKTTPPIAPLLWPTSRRGGEGAPEARASTMILSVGSVTPHKNQMALAEAFYRLYAAGKIPGWELCLAGNINPDFHQTIADYKLKCPVIKFLGHVSDQELDALYRRSAFTVFPSLMEGFGLPISESLDYGRPCVCANFGAMAEVADTYGGCLTVDVADPDQLGQAIFKLISDEPLYEALRREALNRKRPGWADYAADFSRLLSREGDPRRRLERLYLLVGLDGGLDRLDYPGSEALAALARAAVSAEAAPLAAIWDRGRSVLRPASAEELKSGGLADLPWAAWQEPSMLVEPAWLVVGGLSEAAAALERYAREIGLLSAWLLPENSPDEIMSALVGAAKIFPTSKRAKAQFIKFLATGRRPFHSLEDRLETCPRPQRSSDMDLYAGDILLRLALSRPLYPKGPPKGGETAERRKEREKSFYASHINLPLRPLLSVCVSTYNRAEWLKVSLLNLTRVMPAPDPEIEILVCDNTSTDHTPEVVKPYLARPDFRYHRNPKNVGMLGNLRVTANLAKGRYVWILGDDDLIFPQAVRNVVEALRERPNTAMVYMNYAYTREESPKKADDLDLFLAGGVPIAAPGPDRHRPLYELAALNENCFTAIYCQAFRRDYALNLFSQVTADRPFSSLRSCVPTALYVLTHMLDEEAYWLGRPQLVVNFNVSWMRYAPLFALERVQELWDLAERRGLSHENADHWRTHNAVHSLTAYWRIFFEEEDPCGNARYFSPLRCLMRLRHLKIMDDLAPELESIYARAHAAGHELAKVSPELMFAAFKPRPMRKARLYIDMSNAVDNPDPTGIPRVLKNVASAGLAMTGAPFEVQPVCLRKGTLYPADAWLAGRGLPPPDQPVDFLPGDILLMADAVWGSYDLFGPVLDSARLSGVKIATVIYDLIPLNGRRYLPEGLSTAFEAWIRRAAADSDALMCISRAVQGDVRAWLAANMPEKADMEVGCWHLGADFSGPVEAAVSPELTARLGARRFFLMVGTIEPRKNHALALAAMKLLWAGGSEVGLCVVGMPGWMVDDVMTELRGLGDERLIYLDKAGDGDLRWLYEHAVALLFVSAMEGFGLPLIEAAYYKLPIICSDIPVFREIAGDRAFYVRAEQADELAADIRKWLEAEKDGQVPESDGLPFLSWKESAARLFEALSGAAFK